MTDEDGPTAATPRRSSRRRRRRRDEPMLVRHGHERRRPVDDGQRPGGPRLVRRRQPAAAAAAVAGRPATRRTSRGAGAMSAGSPPSSTCAPRGFFDHLQTASTSSRARGLATQPRLPRRHRRGARPPVRVASAARTRCRATAGCSTASRASGPCSADLRAEADVVIDTSGLNVHQLAKQGRIPSSPATARPQGADRGDVVRLQVRRARSTPTSSSTCASCPTRSGSPSCGNFTGRDAPVAEFVMAQDGAPRSSSTGSST